LEPVFLVMWKIKQISLFLNLCLVLGALFVITPTYAGAGAHLPHGIAVTIQPAKSTFGAADSLSVSIRYTNISNSSIRFLTRGTALENEINENFLTIKYQGQPLVYTGRHVKRLPPTDSDYISLSPGQSASGTIDLASGYPMFEKGIYEISYKNVELNFSSALSKSSNAVSMELTQDRLIQAQARTPNIDGSCNATQRAQITEALGIAERIAISARDALRSAPVELRPTARRYTEWFGQFSSARYATAQTAFDRIASALSNQTIGFDCTCNISNRENVFAFVFANDPFNMNVCPVFFRVRPSGTDSRSGTIVHEISHFNVVIGSDDFQSALNQSGSRQLANSNPSAAIRNANAFEYFAENTPFLPMPTAADLPSPPDLTVSSISSSDQNPRVEDIVSFTAAIRNAGESQSSSTSVTLRLSTDAQITTSDTQIEQGSIPALSSGAIFNFQTNFEAPDQPGQFFIGVCVSSVSGETNTGNNCSEAVPLLVDPSPPDLVVGAISSTDQNPTVDDPVNVTAVVSNIGESESASTQATLRLSNDALISTDDEQIGQGSVPTLNSGASFSFQTSFVTPDRPGQLWIGICVTSVSSEITTNNNCSTAVPLLIEERLDFIPPILFLLLDEDSE